MADAVTTRVLQDSDDFCVMYLTNISDGTGEAAVLKVDVSTLANSRRNGAACTEVSIVEIEAATTGMAVQLLWDAATDVPAALFGVTSAGFISKMDFLGVGITNDAGAGKTGDINLTTFGHTAGDTYAITLKMRKKYAS